MIQCHRKYSRYNSCTLGTSVCLMCQKLKKIVFCVWAFGGFCNFLHRQFSTYLIINGDLLQKSHYKKILWINKECINIKTFSQSTHLKTDLIQELGPSPTEYWCSPEITLKKRLKSMEKISTNMTCSPDIHLKVQHHRGILFKLVFKVYKILPSHPPRS